MIILNHGASFGVAEDVALVDERVHPATMAAEGPLHELGAIAIVNSDSQGMGRMMETVRRTFQLAHVMRSWAGTTRGDDPYDDTERILRYLAKVTIEPAITHGIADHVGSLQPGRLADIVLWEPAWFGVKPALVLKGGAMAWAPLGEGNATVEGAEPTRYRPDWGGTGRAAARGSVTFVSGDGRRGTAHGRGAGRPRPPARRRPRDPWPDPRRRWRAIGPRPPSRSMSAMARSAWTAVRWPSIRSARSRSAAATCCADARPAVAAPARPVSGRGGCRPAGARCRASNRGRRWSAGDRGAACRGPARAPAWPCPG